MIAIIVSLHKKNDKHRILYNKFIDFKQAIDSVRQQGL